MPEILQLAEFSERNSMPEMKVRRGWIGAVFDAKGLFLLQRSFKLGRKLFFGNELDKIFFKDLKLLLNGREHCYRAFLQWVTNESVF